MATLTGDILGHPQVGVHVSIVGDVLFHPFSLDDDAKQLLSETFDMEMVPFSIGGSSLLGSLVRGNRNGIAVADIASESDLDQLSSYGEVVVMESGVNAAGNLIACNNHGAVVGMTIPGPGCEVISDVLGVPANRVRIAGQDTVGSSLVVNDAGILAHPDISEMEAAIVSDTLGVPLMVGTVCFGSPYVGAGCLASNQSVLAGTGTTGPELNRIEDALGLI
jgi:translation initiation factor 6